MMTARAFALVLAAAVLATSLMIYVMGGRFRAVLVPVFLVLAYFA